MFEIFQGKEGTPEVAEAEEERTRLEQLQKIAEAKRMSVEAKVAEAVKSKVLTRESREDFSQRTERYKAPLVAAIKAAEDLERKTQEEKVVLLKLLAENSWRLKEILEGVKSAKSVSENHFLQLIFKGDSEYPFVQLANKYFEIQGITDPNDPGKYNQLAVFEKLLQELEREHPEDG